MIQGIHLGVLMKKGILLNIINLDVDHFIEIFWKLKKGLLILIRKIKKIEDYLSHLHILNLVEILTILMN